MNETEEEILKDIRSLSLTYKAFASINEELFQEIDDLRNMYATGSGKKSDKELMKQIDKIVEDYHITDMRGENIPAKLEEMHNQIYHRITKANSLAEQYQTLYDKWIAGEYNSSISLSSMVEDIEVRYKEYIDELTAEYESCKGIIDMNKIKKDLLNGEQRDSNSSQKKGKKSEPIEEEQPHIEETPARNKEPEMSEEELIGSNIVPFRPRGHDGGNTSKNATDIEDSAKSVTAVKESVSLLCLSLEKKLCELEKDIKVLENYIDKASKPKSKVIAQLQEKKAFYAVIKQKYDSITDDMKFSDVLPNKNDLLTKINRNYSTYVDNIDGNIAYVDKEIDSKKAEIEYHKNSKKPIVSKMAINGLERDIAKLNAKRGQYVTYRKEIMDARIAAYYKDALKAAKGEKGKKQIEDLENRISKRADEDPSLLSYLGSGALSLKLALLNLKQGLLYRENVNDFDFQNTNNNHGAK